MYSFYEFLIRSFLKKHNMKSVYNNPQSQGLGSQHGYLQEVRKLIESLSFEFKFELEKMDPKKEDLRYELSIKGSVQALFEARTILKEKKMDFWALRDRNILVEVRVSADNDSRYTFIPQKKEVVQLEIEETEHAEEVVLPALKVIPANLSECKNLEEEVEFLNFRLGEKGFAMSRKKLYNRSGKKEEGIFRYTCIDEFFSDFLNLIYELGYKEPYVKVAKKTALNKGTTTLILYLNHRPDKIQAKEKEQKLEIEEEESVEIREKKVIVKKSPFYPSDKRRYKDKDSEEYRILYSAPVDALIDALLLKGNSAHNRFLSKLRKQRKQEGNQDASPP